MDPRKQDLLNLLDQFKEDVENDRINSIAMAIGYMNPNKPATFFLMGAPEQAYFHGGMIQKAVMDMATEEKRPVPAEPSPIVVPFPR